MSKKSKFGNNEYQNVGNWNAIYFAHYYYYLFFKENFCTPLHVRPVRGTLHTSDTEDTNSILRY